MAQSGDGISINEKLAFDLYIKALESKVHGVAYERLAYCYENGIGTDIGLHSGGNIYDFIPVGGKIVQFWTHEKDNKTYCLALTRNELLYTLHIYQVKSKEPIPVCHSILFDEVQSIGITFSE